MVKISPEEIHTQIQWTVVEELSAAEQAKLSEVSRAEYEITPDEVIETIIAEIEEGKRIGDDVEHV